MGKHIYNVALSLFVAVMMVGCQEVYTPIDNMPVLETDPIEGLGATQVILHGVIVKESFYDYSYWGTQHEYTSHYFFLLSEHEDLSDSTRIDALRSSNADSDSCYAHVSGLAPSTTYYYALCVANEYSMVKGEVLSFTTDSAVAEDEKNGIIALDQITAGQLVDLGLSVMWAGWNVGASSPVEYGGYYAWGETEEKEDYSWSTYKWCNGSNTTFTKYCSNSSKGSVDNKTVLDSEDDVAHVAWGDDWRIPTRSEIEELMEKCTWEWGSLEGLINGYLVTGPNGNSIFLPAAGCFWDTENDSRGAYGHYWSSNAEPSFEGSSSYAYSIYFESVDGRRWNEYGSRNAGFTVRPVVSEKIEDKAPETVDAVDLGLSVKWASCNVGAAAPEEYGGYYAWGETEEKSDYSWSTYKWSHSPDSQTKYCTSIEFGTVDNKTVLAPEDDVAHVQWGGSWRMPTQAELDELHTECTWTWTSINGVSGYSVSGNGNSIFLPAAGYRNLTDVDNRGSDGYYWSASLYDYYYSSNRAYYLNFYDGRYDCLGYSRDYGFSVRPVTEY